eukprot:618808_1
MISSVRIELQTNRNNNDCAISTNTIKGSIRVLLNSTKLNWITVNHNNKIIPIHNTNDKKCPLCFKKRNKANYHLIWKCDHFQNTDISWLEKEDYKQNIIYLEEIQTKIGLL